MSSLTIARHQWAEGKRQLNAAGVDTARSRHLTVLVEAVAAELPKRVGQTFTLAELAHSYYEADRWLYDVLGSARHLALVQDAAFHLYARRAVDYAP